MNPNKNGNGVSSHSMRIHIEKFFHERMFQCESEIVLVV